MKNLLLTALMFFNFNILWSQVVPYSFEVPELNFTRAERLASFNVGGNIYDRLEIVNATSFNGMFMPTIWAHRESSNTSTLQLQSSISELNDNGIHPVMVFVSSIPETINLNSPNGTQFPWGDGGTMNKVENRPTFSWLNARTVQMTLAANGNLGVGRGNPSQRLSVNGNISSFANVILADETFITNSTSITNGLDVVTNLNPVAFTWVTENESDLELDDKLHSGFIAQELETLLPHLVTTTSTEKSINYNELIPYLVNAIKELNNEIEEIKDGIVRVKPQTSNNDISFVISPNPTTYDINIKLNKTINEPVQIIIFSANGQRVKTIDLNGIYNEQNISVQEMPQGTYILKIIGASTNLEGKIIKL